jgi:hypothetical protein
LGTVWQRALGKFERAARLREFEDWRPRLRAQLKRFGMSVAQEYF